MFGYSNQFVIINFFLKREKIVLVFNLRQLHLGQKNNLIDLIHGMSVTQTAGIGLIINVKESTPR